MKYIKAIKIRKVEEYINNTMKKEKNAGCVAVLSGRSHQKNIAMLYKHVRNSIII